MPDTGYLLAAVALSVAVTWSLRALPFTIVSRLRSSDTVRLLSTRMPLGVMVILVAYSLHELPLGRPTESAAAALGLAGTAGLHLWRRNPLLSIVGGTTIYVLLATTTFGR